MASKREFKEGIKKIRSGIDPHVELMQDIYKVLVHQKNVFRL